jgi:hypothetical protein
VARFVLLQVALVTPIVLALVVWAAIGSFRRRAEPAYRICALFSLPLLVLAAVLSPFVWVKGNWLAAAYPAALLAAAALTLERRGRLAGIAAGGVALALAGSVYAHLVPLSPRVPFPARDEVSSGWRALAERVQTERDRVPEGFVAGCNYKVSAELAYYLPDKARTLSGEIAGDHGLQYRYWFDPDELRGREGIVVQDEREQGTCRRLADACDELVPMEPLTVWRGSSPVTTFRLWRCTYAGPPRG